MITRPALLTCALISTTACGPKPPVERVPVAVETPCPAFPIPPADLMEPPRPLNSSLAAEPTRSSSRGYRIG